GLADPLTHRHMTSLVLPLTRQDQNPKIFIDLLGPVVPRGGALGACRLDRAWAAGLGTRICGHQTLWPEAVHDPNDRP
ncbi:hypothetical protein, partial [Streptomyces stelliscabiei]|uniref:hypothetical protein n=1 Tax=Streptomyces stelliscabiei TaxID=146820 RepID=UPI0029AC40FA